MISPQPTAVNKIYPNPESSNTHKSRPLKSTHRRSTTLAIPDAQAPHPLSFRRASEARQEESAARQQRISPELTARGICYNRAMPTVLRSGPYRFYFYSHEPNEPPHVHVDRDDVSAKFWLDPVQLAANLDFAPTNCGRYNQ